MSKRPRPLTLIILDGWGDRSETDANAIALAHKPNWDQLIQSSPHTLISGSGRCVGLPDGQMGNSEVGHLNMGAGRIVHQDLTRIDQAIVDGEFFTNPVLVNAITESCKNNTALHILGLLSPGGVHSHERQLHALLELAAKQQAKRVYIHAILDGRDTPPRSAKASLQALTDYCQKIHCGKIVSLIGRYYAMDRDHRYERIQKAYDLLTLGAADYQAADAISGLEMAYARNENDEFVKATVIQAPATEKTTIQDGDTVIFMNFRADRARELTHALIDNEFNGFKRTLHPMLHLVTLTEYDKKFNVPIAFPPEPLQNILADYISQLGLTQLRIAETEKYAHVTFFFNGGIETPFPLEDRILIPSPKVSTYDLQPEMSAHEVTEQLVNAIHSEKYDLIICNFANADMVGHTGDLDATIKAIETIDTCLGKIVHALHNVKGEAIITADHGNAEMMYNHHTHQPHTAHTTELVPFLYIGRPATITHAPGKLSDIAPTLLYLMDLPIPAEMTGQPLLRLESI